MNFKAEIEKKLNEVRLVVLPGFREIFGPEAETRMMQEGHFLNAEMVKSISVRGPNLHECTTESLSYALIQCVTMGWTLNPSMKQVSLVPRYIKQTQERQAILQDQYHGWIYLLKKSGDIIDCITGAIDEVDTFEYQDTHEGFKWNWKKGQGERKKLLGVFCAFRMPDGFIRGRYYTRHEIGKRAKVATTDYIWKAWPEEMAAKTGIRMAISHLPKSETISKLEKFDNQNYNLNLVSLPESRKLEIEEAFKNADSALVLNGAWMEIEPAYRGDDWVIEKLRERKAELLALKASPNEK